ncbi:uncharacterized protein LOC135388411 [Ornithodoros turicata]|uniref:uncharacterized protein LOC135388411 n=1 Tax=Ornithodoros turicata TaxID=34597 RepID=UPI00313A077F
MTIRFLAIGDHQSSISYAFRVGRSTASMIISETCKAIWDCLKDTYVKCPQSTEEREGLASTFEQRWNFPDCIGAIDGKHVTIECLRKTGRSNFNCKRTFSKVLMAIADAEYKFLYVSMGSPRSESDGGIFAKSDIIRRLETSTLGLPSVAPLSDGTMLPYMFVGDEAFPLRTYLMRPYPKRRADQHPEKVFNLRLSRARRVVENSFGILCSRWRILRRPFKASERNVKGTMKFPEPPYFFSLETVLPAEKLICHIFFRTKSLHCARSARWKCPFRVHPLPRIFPCPWCNYTDRTSVPRYVTGVAQWQVMPRARAVAAAAATAAVQSHIQGHKVSGRV